ncbi:MAG: hypothetical protein IJD22_03665 [Clostridia bacterium]|nr:hypothetical protein [Clostridia bacterium]
MTEIQTLLISVLLIVSAAFIAVPLVCGIIEAVIRAAKGVEKKKAGQFARSLLALTGMVVGSVLCMRLAVEVFLHVNGGGALSSFNWWEGLMNSIVRTLETFSLDEDYDVRLAMTREMMIALAGEGSALVNLFTGFAAFMNVLAPVAGGAIIFDILSSIFPLLRLFGSYLFFWNPKYYFSELNDRALSLAKSICETEKTLLTRPVIIFTNVYADKESETVSELIYKAKLLGAICLPDDLNNILKNPAGQRKFILINENEAENLQMLTGLASEKCYKCLKKAEVYLFSQDDVYILIEEQVNNFLKGKLPEEKLPTIVPVQRYRNLATNLFDDMPLYEPVIGKERDENGAVELNVTVIGAGRIGTEMLLCAYWCGQMLNCRLHFNIVSDVTKEQFEGALNHINPELLRSMSPEDGILRINEKGEYSSPYCSLRYVQANVMSGNIRDILMAEDGEGRTLLDTDYYIVCLGSDDLNVSIANSLRMAVGSYHLSEKEERKTVVSYVVFDPELCRVLNVNSLYDYSEEKGADVCMYAFGSLDEMYSTRNVFIKELELKDKSTIGLTRASYIKKRRETHKSRAEDNYSYWSHIARNRHIIYKIFSAGLYKLSVFDVAEGASDPAYKADRDAALAKYKELIYGEGHDIKLMHRLAWLEHRRWCAFLRTRGFSSTEEYVNYYDKYSSHKNMDLKLHPCLVESSDKGIKATFDKIGNVKEMLLFTETGAEDMDMLDKVSVNVRKKKAKQKDFKVYDYPVEDFREMKRKA